MVTDLKNPPTVWASDLGKGSLGEAVRDLQTSDFLHKASLLIPPELARRGPATTSGTPASRYRAMKTRQAHRERERWLETVWKAAGLTPLKAREVWENPATGKWELKHAADYQLEREFAPKRFEKKDSQWVEIKYPDGRAADGAPAAAPEDFETCYTSCLLRIKLLQWKEGDPMLAGWQIFKALRAALQRRGYGRVPWAAKEALKQPTKEEEAKELQTAARWQKFKKGFKQDEDPASDPNRSPIPPEFHFPCYYDAFNMGLWNPAEPDTLRSRPDHRAGNTRNVRFDRADVRRELTLLGNQAAAMLPQLRKAFDRWQREGWKFPHPVTGKKLTRRVQAQTFGEFLCDGPAGQPEESFEKFLKQRRNVDVRRGTFEEWMGGLGQKTPSFDNRIVENCALIPRLHVCRIAPIWRKKPDGEKETDPRSLLAAEVTYLLQLKNIQTDDAVTDSVRFLNTDELNEWLEHALAQVQGVPMKDGWHRRVLECFKITRGEWRKWCISKKLLPISDERAEGGPSAGPEDNSPAVEAASGDSGTERQQSRGKSKDIVKAPKPTGRSRFCRPALAILRHLLLHKESPIEFAQRLRAGNEELQQDLGFELAAAPPLRTTMKERATKEKGRPWILFDDLDFLGHLWKPTDDKGNPRAFEPYQLRIPDMALRHLRKKHGLTEEPYSQLLRQNSGEMKRRETAIQELIGQQNNPIVRDRLTRFWHRLRHFQNPIVCPDPKMQRPGLGLEEPSCLVLEFVRDDKDNSLEGQKRADAIKEALKHNEERREKARKALDACNLPTNDDMVVRWLMLDAQGPACIYTNAAIGCSDLPNLQIEHIVPRALGGPDAFWNWVLCREDANAEKGNRIPYDWFKEERTDVEWADYKRRVLSRAAKLGRRKVDLLLRSDAAELVGEKYTALAQTGWIARLAQSVARLHFGWPRDDEPGKEERVITISGGLTARIRRKYLLDSLLGADDDAVKLRQDIDEVLNELEALRNDSSLGADARKQKRAKLRHRLSRLAGESEKNREDHRHHALDAMLLTFLPNWARDRNKEDFFRFPTKVGDNDLYSDADKPKIACIKSERDRLYEENKPAFRQIKQARLAGDYEKMQELKASIFPVRKRMAELYRALDKLKQPRNIRDVREWFRARLEGQTSDPSSRVLPTTVARERTPIEATLYRRVYLVHRDHAERSLVCLKDLAFAPDLRDPTQRGFDLKWLRARVQSITDHVSYDRKALKNVLNERLEAAIAAREASARRLGEMDWQTICADSEVAACFQPVGHGKNKRPPQPSQGLVKVCKVEVLPATRYPLADLAFATGNNSVWNPDHFEETIKRILRKDDSQVWARARGRRRAPAPLPKQPASPDASPWPAFLWDHQIQAKMRSAAFRQDLEQQLAPCLLPPKPARMSDAEREEWAKKKDAWNETLEGFRRRHDLPKRLYLFTSESDRPPKRPAVALESVFFERRDKVFSRDALAKQADWVVDVQLRDCLNRFADSLSQEQDARQQEGLWKQFCDAVCVVSKKSLEKFTSERPTPTAEQWVSFFKNESGPHVAFVMQTVGTSLEEYFDLSKDACGAFAKGGNKGYWLCKKQERIEARPIRYFESPKQVKDRLVRSGWELLDSKPWLFGDLLQVPEAIGSGARAVPAGYYFLGSFSNDTGANLNACFGGEVPQNVSLKALWNQGLRRCSQSSAN